MYKYKAGHLFIITLHKHNILAEMAIVTGAPFEGRHFRYVSLNEILDLFIINNKFITLVKHLFQYSNNYHMSYMLS